MAKTIPLTRGTTAIVDDEDFAWLSRWKWHCNAQGYAVRTVARSERVGGVTKKIRMHRELISVPVGFEVDHINGDRLDNRKCNLRVCTRLENQRNQRPSKVGKSSRYKGVFWHRQRNKWSAQISMRDKSTHIGVFATEEEAAWAYDDAARYYFGEFACLNFPDRQGKPYQISRKAPAFRHGDIRLAFPKNNLALDSSTLYNRQREAERLQIE